MTRQAPSLIAGEALIIQVTGPSLTPTRKGKASQEVTLADNSKDVTMLLSAPNFFFPLWCEICFNFFFSTGLATQYETEKKKKKNRWAAIASVNSRLRKDCVAIVCCDGVVE